MSTWIDLHELVNAKFPDNDYTWAPLKGRTDWAAAVAFEKKAAGIDAGCRADLADYAIGAALPALQGFQAANVSALATVNHQWAGLRAQFAAPTR